MEPEKAAEGDPVCFGCSVVGGGGRRRPNRAHWLVGDRQGHTTVECTMHAQLVLTRGGSWAIPLASLCVVTDASSIGEALASAALAEQPEPVGNAACPTYAQGFTIDLERR